MRATRPARALAWAVDFLDHYWGPLGVAVLVVLEAFVFAPREMLEWILGGGIVGAALLVTWMGGGSR